MKKIIEGKRYDTDTANLVASWDNGKFGDFGFIEEALYRKRTGEYFIHGEGGAQTRYAQAYGDSWGGGEQIMPVSYDKAISWAQEHMSADAFEEHFGAVGEGDAVLSSPISAAAKEKLVRTALERGVAQRVVLEELLSNL